MLALLSSMPFESELVLSGMDNARSRDIAGKSVCYGRIGGVDVLIASTGIGRVNAAHMSTCVVENFPVSRIINLGAGGAYPGSGLGIGDVAVASREISGDEGVIDAEGWGSLKKIGIPVIRSGGKTIFNEFPLDLPHSAIKNEIEKREGDFVIKSGAFVTVSAATGTGKRAKDLEKRFNAICENMEGAAIAHICAIYNIPMFEVRGISNVVGVRDKRKWNLKLASGNCQAVVLGIIDEL